MTPTPVGMRCPECAKQRTQVRNLAQPRGGTEVTRVLIAINVIAFVAELSSGSGGGFGNAGGSVVQRGALFGPSISFDHDYYRLITSGFLHAGFLHIAFNMYLLWIIGQMLEPAVGPLRFGAIYFTSLLAGSFGALLVAPNSVTVGASGAVFGLMGAAFLDLRHRGFDPMQSGLGALILFNLVLSFVLSNISWGGHVGGLIGGSLAALVIQLGDRMRSQAVGLLGCVALSAVADAGAIAVA
jgi:membrane associated rhomboid family serine protease